MKIAIRGAVSSTTGYAVVVRELSLALYRLGAGIHLRPIPWGITVAELPAATENLLNSLIANSGRSDGLLNIAIPPCFERFSSGPSVGLTMLEVDGLSRDWAFFCNQQDEVWVPTRFNYETFQRSGVSADKIRVMPLGIDGALFTPNGPGMTAVNPGGFTFLSVFEWNPRKGYDLLLAAYLQEFRNTDNVCLVLKSHSNCDYDPNGTAITGYIQEMAGRYCPPGSQAPPIVLMTQLLPSHQMPELYRMADCFVLPTRGEGWNIPALEALACGVPVITTAWSAHLDWLTEDNAFLIDIEGLEFVPHRGDNNDAAYDGLRWARPSIEHLRYLMRWVYEHNQEARQKALSARPMIESGLSWEASAQRMYQRLQELIPPRSCC